MPKICFATGNLYRFMDKINVLDFISNLDVDGVEYTFGKDYFERPVMEKDFDLLRSYEFVSFHWPFKLSLKKYSEEELFKQTKLIEEVYLKADSKQIVIHPQSVMPASFFSNSKMFFITENMNTTKWNKNRPRLSFELELAKRPNFGLCLDACHAYSWSKEETGRIVKKYKHNIKEVHFSNCRYTRSHLSFEKVSKNFLKSIEPLRELDVPIVIEEDMRSCSKSFVKAEIKRVKQIIGI